MTDPIPINLAAIEQRAGQRETRQIVASQIASQVRFEEEVEQMFNPGSVAREQSRRDKFKHLNERKQLPEEVEKQWFEVTKKAEEDLAQSYNRRNSELSPDKLRDLRDSLNPSRSADYILREVLLRNFSDPTLADETLEYLEQETTGIIRENVRGARALLVEQREREIVAGRNIDPAVKALDKKKEVDANPTDLRNLYRTITGSSWDHNALFTELSQRYPFSQLEIIVAFLLKGLAYDLKSKGPSIQEAELMRLMTETRNLQSILWVYLFFKSRMPLIRSLYSQYGKPISRRLHFEALAKEYIRFVEERYPSVLKLLKQAEHLGLLEEYELIIVLSQYRDAIRQLSPRLYKSVKHRQDLYMVILEALEEIEERLESEEER